MEETLNSVFLSLDRNSTNSLAITFLSILHNIVLVLGKKAKEDPPKVVSCDHFDKEIAYTNRRIFCRGSFERIIKASFLSGYCIEDAAFLSK